MIIYALHVYLNVLQKFRKSSILVEEFDALKL